MAVFDSAGSLLQSSISLKKTQGWLPSLCPRSACFGPVPPCAGREPAVLEAVRCASGDAARRDAQWLFHPCLGQRRELGCGRRQLWPQGLLRPVLRGKLHNSAVRGAWGGCGAAAGILALARDWGLLRNVSEVLQGNVPWAFLLIQSLTRVPYVPQPGVQGKPLGPSFHLRLMVQEYQQELPQPKYVAAVSLLAGWPAGAKVQRWPQLYPGAVGPMVCTPGPGIQADASVSPLASHLLSSPNASVKVNQKEGWCLSAAWPQAVPVEV